MKYTSLDTIANNILLSNGLSIHYYMQTLLHSANCLRELQFDVTGNIRTKKLEINSYGAVELPCDYVDYVRIGTPLNGTVQPSATLFGSNRLVNIDEKGNKVPYGGSGWCYGDQYGAWIYPDGLHPYGPRHTDGFMIVNERREVQFSNYREGGFVILDYITDGSEVDNATMVHAYAQKTIESYGEWKMKKGSEDEFNKQYRILRGRKNNITPANVRAIIKNAYGKFA